jgi:hypothetical protein
MRHYFGINGWPSSTMGPVPTSEAEQTALIDALQDRKTAIYKELIASGTVPVRPGFSRVVAEAKVRLIRSHQSIVYCKELLLYVLLQLVAAKTLHESA